MNNQKLKAFLDAYHAPYKGSHRYWPGLMLLLRLALLLVFGSNALGDTSVNLLAISAASFGLMVLAWMSRGVYKNQYLDALEASYILNLGTLAVATNHVQQAGGNQAAVAYISTGVAFATFIATVFYHVYLRNRKSGVCPHPFTRTTSEESLPDRLIHAEEYEELLAFPVDDQEDSDSDNEQDTY